MSIANHVLFHSYSPDLSTNGTWSGFKAMTHFIFRILSSASYRLKKKVLHDKTFQLNSEFDKKIK